MQYVVGRNGNRIAYKISGSPDASIRILFTMGLGGSIVMWEEQEKYFLRKKGHACVFYENRGIGKSESVEGRWTTKEMAHDALDVLDNIGWTENVHLVGLSMTATQQRKKDETVFSLLAISRVFSHPLSPY